MNETPVCDHANEAILQYFQGGVGYYMYMFMLCKVDLTSKSVDETLSFPIQITAIKHFSHLVGYIVMYSVVCDCSKNNFN